MKRISTQPLSIAMLISITSPIFLYGMDSVYITKEFFEDFRTLLVPELQEKILLSQDTITFLGQQPITLTGHTRAIKFIAIHEDKVITGSPNDIAYIHDKVFIDSFAYHGKPNKSPSNVIKIWNIHTGECLRTFATRSYIKCLASNGYKIATGSINKTIRIWDISTGECLHVLTKPKKWKSPNNKITSIAMSDKYVISGALDGTIRIWNINTGKPLRMIIGHNDRIVSLAINGETVVCTSTYGRIKIRNIKTGTCLPIFNIFNRFRYNQEISSVAINDTIVAIELSRGITEIWDIHTGKLLKTIDDPNEYGEWFYSIAISGNKAVIGASYHAKIWEWDITTARCTHTLTDYKHDQICSVAINDRVAVTGSYDTTAKIWSFLLNLKGTHTDNPLLWIVQKADIPQLNFINRACATTNATNDFIIAMPKELNNTEEHEPQAQWDGRVYFTFPLAVREYLRTRLNIRK